jgi:hypothetical protein
MIATNISTVTSVPAWAGVTLLSATPVAQQARTLR